MSYGLESFCKLLNLFADYILITQKKEQNAVNKSEAFDYLLRSNEGQTIVKELEALEVIGKKRVNTYSEIILCADYDEYLHLDIIEDTSEPWRLTPEEFELLKEVLK